MARWGLNEGSGGTVGDSMASPAVGAITGSGYSWVAGFVPPAPDLPPAAPTGLAASASRAGIALTWDANGESDLAGYNVYRSTSPGVTIGTPINASTPDRHGLSRQRRDRGVTYYYVVTAVDNGSTSRASRTRIQAQASARA